MYSKFLRHLNTKRCLISVLLFRRTSRKNSILAVPPSIGCIPSVGFWCFDVVVTWFFCYRSHFFEFVTTADTQTEFRATFGVTGIGSDILDDLSNGAIELNGSCENQYGMVFS